MFCLSSFHLGWVPSSTDTLPGIQLSVPTGFALFTVPIVICVNCSFILQGVLGHLLCYLAFDTFYIYWCMYLFTFSSGTNCLWRCMGPITYILLPTSNKPCTQICSGCQGGIKDYLFVYSIIFLQGPPCGCLAALQLDMAHCFTESSSTVAFLSFSICIVYQFI